MSYYDVQASAGGTFNHSLPEENNSFLYLFEGSGQLGTRNLPLNTLVALGREDNSLAFTAGDNGARFILISGKPINEPVVQHGPFVMNTRQEIEQAMQDFQSNTFVHERAWVNHRVKGSL